jgi:hypothetical protein
MRARSLLFHQVGGHQQLAVRLLVRVAGQHVEQVRDIGPQIRVAGEKANVAVQTRRDIVVVAGAHVHIAADAIPFAAHDEQKLGVDLEAHQPIDHVHARLLQGAGPSDVVLLVKARLELHQHGHLFAVFACLHQRGHDGRVGPHAVEGLLDGQHVRILDSLLQEMDHRGKAVVGMVEHDVLRRRMEKMLSPMVSTGGWRAGRVCPSGQGGRSW